jgi:2-dehydropantoate 2-reductase
MSRTDQKRPADSAGTVPGRVAVIGAGAMGISLSALLGRRVPVTIVARDGVMRSMLGRSGTVVRGALAASSRPTVVDSIAALADGEAPDAIFVATKTTAIDRVAAALRSVFEAAESAATPFVISFQNGIEPGRRLMERLEHPRVVRMVLNYGARLAGDGAAEVAHHTPPNAVGGPDARHRPFCLRLATLLTECGLQTVAVDDIEPLVWTKGIINAAMNPVAALIDGTVGEVIDAPARTIVGRLLHEGICVAQAEGTALGPEPLARMWDVLEHARGHTPSMVEDIRAGRESEVGQLNRQIVAHGERAGVETPTHRMIAALIESFDWRIFCRDSRN